MTWTCSSCNQYCNDQFLNVDMLMWLYGGRAVESHNIYSQNGESQLTDKLVWWWKQFPEIGRMFQVKGGECGGGGYLIIFLILQERNCVSSLLVDFILLCFIYRFSFSISKYFHILVFSTGIALCVFYLDEVTRSNKINWGKQRNNKNPEKQHNSQTN